MSMKRIYANGVGLTITEHTDGDTRILLLESWQAAMDAGEARRVAECLLAWAAEQTDDAEVQS